MDVFLQQAANALVLGGSYSLITLGLFLVYNSLHIPNFAHGEMFTLGAYLQYTFTMVLHLPFFLALSCSVVVAGIVGAILERMVFSRLQRGTGFSMLVGTLALGIALHELIALFWGRDFLSVVSPMPEISTFGPVRIANYRILIVVIVFVAAALVALLVYRTSYGRSLRAIAQNREIAELSGVNVPLVVSITFALSAALAGLAGGLLAPTTTLDPAMGFNPTLVAFAILIAIGAGGRTTSVVAAAFIIAFAETLAAAYISNTARTAVVFIALVIFVILRPEGAKRSSSATKVLL